MRFDANWLLSTVAQSTAALVAIVGGFLVSRAISFSSERTGLVNRLQETLIEIHTAQGSLLEEVDSVYATAFKWFVDEHVESAILEKGLGLKPDDMWIARGTRAEDESKMWDALNEHIKTAIIEISKIDNNEIPSDVDIGQLVAMGINVPSAAEKIYERVANAIYEESNPRKKSSKSNSTTAPITKSDLVFQRQDQAIARRDALQASVGHLEEQRRMLVRQVDGQDQRENLLSGLKVLAIFGVVGMIYPICLLAWKPIGDPWFLRVSVIVGFSGGFASLLIFIRSHLIVRNPDNQVM
jgi:hypothetical protein